MDANRPFVRPILWSLLLWLTVSIVWHRAGQNRPDTLFQGLADIIREAQQLWMLISNSQVSSNWSHTLGVLGLRRAVRQCRVYLTANAEFIREMIKRQELLSVWAELFQGEWKKRCELEQFKKHQQPREGASPSNVFGVPSFVGAPVNDEGLLQIQWPRLTATVHHSRTSTCFSPPRRRRREPEHG